MPAIAIALNIARYTGGAWLSISAWTFLGQVIQTRRCLTGYFGPAVQEEYEQIFKRDGSRKAYAYDARLCLLKPWAAVRRLAREGAHVREKAGNRPVPVQEYVPRPLRPF